MGFTTTPLFPLMMGLTNQQSLENKTPDLSLHRASV